MTSSSPVFSAQALDVRRLARAHGIMQGAVALADLPRWREDAPEWPQADAAAALQLDWQARAELRTPPGGAEQVWLRLTFTGQVPQICQRCLSVYLQPLAVDRWFRFVADEATAEAEDDDAEEDLLVWTPRFNLLELVEDELFLALPLVPMHDVCPQALPTEAVDADFHQAERPHPFAALAALKGRAGRPGPGQEDA